MKAHLTGKLIVKFGQAQTQDKNQTDNKLKPYQVELIAFFLFNIIGLDNEVSGQDVLPS